VAAAAAVSVDAESSLESGKDRETSSYDEPVLALEKGLGTEVRDSEAESASAVSGSGSSSKRGSSLRVREVLPDDHPYATAAIWHIPPRALFFQADRSVAKKLAKAIMAPAATQL
jgi:hypothetical protein